MTGIKTVLCPVDFTAATRRQVDLAAGVCRAFGARLVIQHNLVEPAIGSAVGWMWAVSHPNSERVAEEKLLDVLAQVPPGTEAEVRLTHGSVADAVLAVAEATEADLVVLSTSGVPSDGRGTVTERVLDRAALPVFAVHAALQDHRTPRLDGSAGERQTLLVPIDLTAASAAALDVALDLADRFAFDVHVLHVLADDERVADRAAADDARRALAEIGRDAAKVVGRHLERGDPAEVIARVADRMSADCIVMGEQAKGPLRHWFRRATSQGVLHAAPCPIWYVPEPPSEADARQAAAAATRGAPPSGGRLVDELKTVMFHYWPTAQLYAVVDSPEAAESALRELMSVGVRREDLHTWHGVTGAEALDPTGRSHGRVARLWRALEKATGERELLDRYAGEVEQGHVCIGVRCGGPGRRTLEAVLEKHGAHLLSYFSVGAVERLTA